VLGRALTSVEIVSIRHFRLRVSGKRPWRAVRRRFPPAFPVVYRNEQQFRRCCSLTDLAPTRDTAGTTRNSCPRTKVRVHSQAVCLICPPQWQRLGGKVLAGGTRKALMASAVAAFDRRIRSDREIDLTLEGIDAHNEDAYLIADAESFARSSANELPSSRLE
jgi:hypothetical protein